MEQEIVNLRKRVAELEHEVALLRGRAPQPLTEVDRAALFMRISPKEAREMLDQMHWQGIILPEKFIPDNH